MVDRHADCEAVEDLMRFGPYALDSVNDGSFRLDGGAMFGIVPKPLWSRLIEPDERNRITLATNCLLVRGPSGNVLIETGLGDHYSEKQHGIYAFDFSWRLLDGLSGLGVAPEDVDVVVQTHLHFDHSGSLVQRSSGGRYAPTFPRAEVVVQRGEWQAALRPDARSEASYFPPDYYRAVEKSGLLRLIEGEEEVAPGLFALPKGGHTLHHQIVELRDGERKLIYLGDLIPTSAHLRLPYIMGYDLFPLITLEAKQEFMPRAIDEGWTVAFAHDTSICFATLHKVRGRTTARPVEEV